MSAAVCMENRWLYYVKYSLGVLLCSSESIRVFIHGGTQLLQKQGSFKDSLSRYRSANSDEATWGWICGKQLIQYFPFSAANGKIYEWYILKATFEFTRIYTVTEWTTTGKIWVARRVLNMTPKKVGQDSYFCWTAPVTWAYTLNAWVKCGSRVAWNLKHVNIDFSNGQEMRFECFI